MVSMSDWYQSMLLQTYSRLPLMSLIPYPSVEEKPMGHWRVMRARGDFIGYEGYGLRPQR